ncbi:hypothetical protein R1flu_026249 [Riccia fluitans]|uniref:Uncharacterized protein n=1 Tax=Riccia fluitans TaxID=41844 RepID=A0ABD1XIE8_9MARC
MRGAERNSNSRNSHSIPPRRIKDTMAMWSEELRRLTLFDGEAELTPESRPVEGIQAKAPREPAGVPLQIINDYLLCKVGSGPTPSRRYNLLAMSTFLRLTYYWLVNWVHMLAGGLASAVKEYVRKFSRGPGEAVVMADVLQGVHSRRAVAKDSLPRILRLKPEERIENASQQAPAQPQPRKRRAPTSSSAPARETQMATRPTRFTRTTAEPKVGVVPSLPREVQEISSTSSPEQPPRKEPRVGEPPQQSEGRQGDTAIPGFEPSDDELPKVTLRRDISRLRQEGQRTEPLVIRETGAGRQALNGSRQRAIEQIPLPPPGQKKKKNKTPAIQSGPEGNSSAQPPAREQRAALATVEEERPDIGPRYTNEEVRRLHLELLVQLGPAPMTAGVPQSIPVEKTLLDRLAEISRLEVMSGIAEEDQAVWDVVRDPDLPCIVPGETSEASMARYSEQMVAVVKHWTMEKRTAGPMF